MDQTQTSTSQPVNVQAVYYVLPRPGPIPCHPYISPLPTAGPPAGITRNPLMMLAQAAGTAQQNSHQQPPADPRMAIQQIIEPVSLPPVENLEDVILDCLGSVILEAFNWCQSGIIPADDIPRLARRVARHTFVIGNHYVKHGAVPSREAVSYLTEVPIHHDDYDAMEDSSELESSDGGDDDDGSSTMMQSTEGTSSSYADVSTSSSFSESNHEDDSTITPPLPRTLEDKVWDWLNGFAPGSCTCGGLPSRHIGGMPCFGSGP